jgi:hypothetical protein
MRCQPGVATSWCDTGRRDSRGAHVAGAEPGTMDWGGESLQVGAQRIVIGREERDGPLTHRLEKCRLNQVDGDVGRVHGSDPLRKIKRVWKFI